MPESKRPRSERRKRTKLVAIRVNGQEDAILAAEMKRTGKSAAALFRDAFLASVAARSQPEPCQCMTSFAAVSPIHPGHCCFVPATQTCHPEEVAEWERGRDRRWGRRENSSSATAVTGETEGP